MFLTAHLDVCGNGRLDLLRRKGRAEDDGEHRQGVQVQEAAEEAWLSALA